MVEALKKLGSNIKYTEFTDKGHNVWDYAFQSSEVLDWLFAQSRETVSNRNTLTENVYWKTENPEWLTLTTNWKKADKGYSATGATAWNKATLDKKLESGSFVFETEVADFSGEQMYVYFGLPDNSKTDNGYSVRLQFNENYPNNNICVYDANNKRKAAWVAFPEASSRQNYKLRVEMSGKLITVLIDGKIVLTTEYLTDYSGGYIGIATNKATATFKNTSVSYKTDRPAGDGEQETQKEKFYPKKQKWNLITSNWEEIRNGYSSEKSSGWSKAGFSSYIDKNEDFIFEADISDFKGAERQLYIYFGLSSSYYLDDGYSVRIQFGKDVGANNIAVYDDIAKKRLVRWTAWPETVSKEKFKITLKMVDKRLSVYADGVLLAICDVPEFKGGYCGIATNKSGADVQNASVAFKTDKTNIPDESYSSKTVDLKYLTNSFEEIKLGLYPTNVNGWNMAVSTAKISGNYIFDADIEYISGKQKQYYFYFGLPKADSLDGGYSVRIQLSEDAKDNNIAVYNDTEKKRVSSWVRFPEGANKEKFHLTVKLSNNVAVVMIDGKTVCTSTVIEGGTDGYYGVAFNRTSGKLINMALSAEVKAVSSLPDTSDNSRLPTALTVAIISLAALMLISAYSRKNKIQRRLSL